VRLPTKAPLHAREVEGELVLRDERSGSTYRLNAVATLVWQLCDGTRDSAAIAAEVAAAFSKTPEAVLGDVAAALAGFADVGLILSSTAADGETDLLLRCVRIAIGTEQGQIGELHGINWNALVHTALRHGVLPLVYRGLQRHTRENIPEIVLDRLGRQYRANHRGNVSL